MQPMREIATRYRDRMAQLRAGGYESAAQYLEWLFVDIEKLTEKDLERLPLTDTDEQLATWAEEERAQALALINGVSQAKTERDVFPAIRDREEIGTSTKMPRRRITAKTQSLRAARPITLPMKSSRSPTRPSTPPATRSCPSVSATRMYPTLNLELLSCSERQELIQGHSVLAAWEEKGAITRYRDPTLRCRLEEMELQADREIAEINDAVRERYAAEIEEAEARWQEIESLMEEWSDAYKPVCDRMQGELLRAVAGLTWDYPEPALADEIPSPLEDGHEISWGFTDELMNGAHVRVLIADGQEAKDVSAMLLKIAKGLDSESISPPEAVEAAEGDLPF